MTNQETANNDQVKGPAFEWWMVSIFAIGAGFSAFVSLLIPPYVSEATGNAAEAGIVMAIISLAAVMGPVLGGFADKYRAHRLVLLGGLLGMVVAFVAYALSAGDTLVTALDAILMGTSIAAISAVAPVFIVGAGKPQALVAKQLTTFNLINPIGQVVGGVLLSVAITAGLSYEARFWIAAAVIFVVFLIVLPTSAKPAAKIQVSEPGSDGGESKPVGLKQVLASTFGVYLLILILSSVGNNGINNQIANIFPNVYGIDSATTSGLISLAGLLNIIFYIVAGKWMARSGAMPDFTFGTVIRLVGSLGLALLGLLTKNAPLVLVAISMQLLYQSNAFIRFAQPVLGVRFSALGPGSASGWVIGAAAIGSFIGSLLGGLLAEAFGYNAINWMATISIAGALLLVIFSLWPAERKKRAAESAAAEAAA
jgi:predicted MFS family arabinose efflux permease